MSDNNKFNEIGEQFKDAVTDALSTGDFQNLNVLVKDTVNTAIEEAKNQAFTGMEAWRGEDFQRTRSKFKQNDSKKTTNMTSDYVNDRRMQHRQRQDAHVTNQTAAPSGQTRSKYDYRRRDGENAAKTAGQRGNAGQNGYPARQTLEQSRRRTMVFRRNGAVSGTLLQVFGGIGTGLLGVASFVIFILLLALKTKALFFVLLGLILLLGGSIFMIEEGNEQKKLLARAEKYFELLGKNSYINIRELEIHTGKSRKFLLKDIKKCIKRGIFPHGHLDMQEDCLMIDDETYQQYLSLEKQRVQMKLSEQERKNPAIETSEMDETQRQLNEMVQEGTDCIRRLREMNDQIRGEKISDKLFKLESVLKEIFARLKEHPEQMPKMHKVMSYYLPTTLKLVAAYQEFDAVSEQGEDIISAKAEIENTLDTINEAFVELLNTLFRDAAYDAATDAKVLKSMLAREGLTKEEGMRFDNMTQTPEPELVLAGAHKEPQMQALHLDE